MGLSDQYEKLAQRFLLKYGNQARRGKTKDPALQLKQESTVQKALNAAIKTNNIHQINITRRALNILKRKKDE